jgi:transcriptional regulator with XRE-family HTH domain/tetratricopeptide (TPR) repeat protein
MEGTWAMYNKGDESSFGTLLRDLRKRAGLSQEELAERSEVSLEAIGALERGKRQSPHQYTRARLADALNLSPKDRALLEGAGRRTLAQTTPRSSSKPPRPRASLPPSGQPSLVGRARELDWLEAGWEVGSPLLLVAGAPGIGKTRLLDEAAGRARKRGWHVLRGDCHRDGGHEPFAPIVEALERYLRPLPPERVQDCVDGCDWLAGLIPELAEAYDLRPPLHEVSASYEQHFMFAAVERFLSNVAGRTKSLLVLDDLQWAGADGLQLLAHLVRRSGRLRVCVLGAYRSIDVPPGHPLFTLKADLAREELASELPLLPLALNDAAALARAELEGVFRETSQGHDRARLERFVERTGGVPFFLVSCARFMQTQARRNIRPDLADDRQGDEPSTTGTQPEDELPWSVTQSVMDRIAILSSSAQALLRAAAVIGQPASGALLAEVGGASEEDALFGLEEACQASLLVEVPLAGTREQYRFEHDLVREVVETSLSAGRRRILHQRTAEALEREGQAGAQARGSGPPLFTRIAYHAARADLPEKAAPYLRQAGDRARAMYAHQDAADHYRDLVGCLDRLGRARDAARARWDLALELSRAGRFGEGLSALQEAERIYREEGDTEAQALVTAAIGTIHVARGTNQEALAVVAPLISGLGGEATENDAARQVLPVSPEALARLEEALAGLVFLAGDYLGALGTAQRAVEVAKAIQDVGLLARGQLRFGVALHTVGRTKEAVENLKRAVEGAEVAQDLETLAEAMRMESWALQTRGAFAQSQAIQPRAMSTAAEWRDLAGIGHAVFLDGLLAFYLGDWAKAHTIAERAREALGQVELTYLSGYPALGLGWLYLVEGQTELGEAYLAEAHDIAARSGGDQVLRFIEAIRAEVDLLEGRPEVARARLAPLFEGGQLQERTRVELTILLAWAAVELGAEEEAGELVRDAVQSAREQEIFLALPDALRIEALLAMRRCDWPTAERALDEARTLCAEMAYPYAEAKVLYVHGLVRAAMGDVEEARARLEAGLVICARLGEGLYAAHVERALEVLVSNRDSNTGSTE